ncbi:DNA-directed DNA polymerase [Tanacetum coccineum]
MEEMLYKFIDEGKREQEEMRAFIHEFRTTNELLFKERNNSLSELKFKIEKRKRRGSTEKVLGKPEATPHQFAFHRSTRSNAKVCQIFERPGEAIKLDAKYMMYEKLDLGEPKATKMSLELADRSNQYPRGIVENVLIKVDKFVLPIDFFILDMPKDSKVPRILGRPFLATTRAMIDVFNKKITLKVGDDEVIFDMDQSIKRSPAEDDECYGVDDLDDAINAEAQELLVNDTTDSFLLKGLEKSIEQSDI